MQPSLPLPVTTTKDWTGIVINKVAFFEDQYQGQESVLAVLDNLNEPDTVKSWLDAIINQDKIKGCQDMVTWWLLSTVLASAIHQRAAALPLLADSLADLSAANRWASSGLVAASVMHANTEFLLRLRRWRTLWPVADAIDATPGLPAPVLDRLSIVPWLAGRCPHDLAGRYARLNADCGRQLGLPVMFFKGCVLPDITPENMVPTPAAVETMRHFITSIPKPSALYIPTGSRTRFSEEGWILARTWCPEQAAIVENEWVAAMQSPDTHPGCKGNDVKGGVVSLIRFGLSNSSEATRARALAVTLRITNAIGPHATDVRFRLADSGWLLAASPHLDIPTVHSITERLKKYTGFSQNVLHEHYPIPATEVYANAIGRFDKEWASRIQAEVRLSQRPRGLRPAR